MLTETTSCTTLCACAVGNILNVMFRTERLVHSEFDKPSVTHTHKSVKCYHSATLIQADMSHVFCFFSSFHDNSTMMKITLATLDFTWFLTVFFVCNHEG